MIILWHTERLILRGFVEQDLDALHAVLGDGGVMRFSLKGPLSRAETADWLEERIRAAAKDEPTQYAAVSKQEGAFLGFSGFIPFSDPDGDATYEVGYRFHPSCWGRGIGTEAVQATVALGFERFRLPALAAVVEEENVASIRILKKVGMSFIGEMLYHEIPVMKYLIRREDVSPGAMSKGS